MRGGAHERWFTCLNMIWRCDVRYYKTSATGEYEIMQRKSIKAVPAELEAEGVVPTKDIPITKISDIVRRRRKPLILNLFLRFFHCDWVKNFLSKAGMGDGEPGESNVVPTVVKQSQEKPLSQMSYEELVEIIKQMSQPSTGEEPPEWFRSSLR
jgi:hypothetical protein